MATLGLWGIWSALALGFAVVLGGPAWLLREWMRPPAWDPQAVEAQFESVRLDGATLVFVYRLQNLSDRKERLIPEIGRLQVLRPEGRPLLGYPAIRLPLDLAPYSSQPAEVRLELANP
jgi:hypothetical protein